MRLRQYILGTTILLSFSLPAVAAEMCSRETLSKQPKWISTVEFNPRTNEIFIADPKGSELLAYNTLTKKVEKVLVPGALSPASVTKIHGGFLVKYKDDAAIIGPNKKLLGITNLRNTPKSGAATGLGSLYSNWITLGSTFVGYGSVTNQLNAAPSDTSNPVRGFQLGFIRGRVSAGFRQFRDIELLEPTEGNEFYLLGFQYFAATDEEIFYVRMVADKNKASNASIMRVREGAKPQSLKVFPKGYQEIPPLKMENIGPSSTASLFEEIEGSKMAVGLYGQGKKLYLLTRERNTGGREGTQWLLHQIDPDPENPRVEGVVRLPTSANHLAVIPTPKDWYFIERGVVRGWGDQENKSILRVPSSWITSPSDSLLALDKDFPPCE